MLKIRRTSQFKKDVKRMLKRGKDLEKLLLVVQDLSARRKLPGAYRSWGSVEKGPGPAPAE